MMLYDGPVTATRNATAVNTGATARNLPPAPPPYPLDIPLPPSSFPLSAQSRAVALQLSDYWQPPVRYELADWVRHKIVLSPEYSARSGPLQLFGWQKEIFNAFTDPYVTGIVCCVGIQMVKTLLLQCATVYSIAEEPGPILIVEPTEDDGKEFSKERMTPMIRDCPALAGLITDSLHDAKNTILSKSFPGGRLSIVSAQRPGNLARRSIRYLFCDEIDKYPASAGKEGNPRDLAKGRLVTFGSRAKWIEACSPTVAGESAIWASYEQSDKRKPYVSCPKCGHLQVLRWANVKFDTKLPREKIPDSAAYQCENPACNALWNDNQRWNACNKAVWKAEKPFAGIAGFWISHLYSPWKKLSAIVDHFLRVKDKPQELKVFINTVLAELWEEKGETPDAQILYAQREDYPHSAEAIVPQRGLFLTAAVDVQDNPPRLECEVKAWGRGRESWSVGYFVLQAFAENGQPLPVTSPELWDKLDAEILQRDWLHESGNTMPIRVMCIDTGSRPKPVYEFAKRHAQISYSGAGLKVHSFRTVVPIKGNDDPLKIISSVSKEDASRKRQNVRIVVVGTHCAKQQIYDNLRAIKPSKDGSPKPGCFHHPMYEAGYFDQLCSEYRIVKEDGSVEYVKRADVRNEALDVAVYNLAAASIAGIERMTEAYWQMLEAAVKPLPVDDETESLHEEVEFEELPNATAQPQLPAGQPALQPVAKRQPVVQAQQPARRLRGKW